MASRGQKRKSVSAPSPAAAASKKVERSASPGAPAGKASSFSKSSSSVANVPFKVVYNSATHGRPGAASKKPKATFGKRRKSTTTTTTTTTPATPAATNTTQIGAANPSRRNSIVSNTSSSLAPSVPTSPVFSPSSFTFPPLTSPGPASANLGSTSPSPSTSPLAPEEQDHFDPTVRPPGLAIHPPALWSSLKSRTFLLISQTLIRTGQTLLIRTPNTALPQGAPIGVEQYPQFWIARLMEIRANEPENVFLLVRWWYWPEEVPGGGRRPWMGRREVLGSDWFDVVRVDSLAGVIETPVEWREGGEGLPEGEGLVWRQWVDGFGRLRGGVRRYCVCGGAWSGEGTMVRCGREGCGVWLHEECVVGDVVRRLHGGGEHDGGGGGAPMTPSPTPTTEVEMKVEGVKSEGAGGAEAAGDVICVDTSAPSTPTKAAKPPKAARKKEKRDYTVNIVHKAAGGVKVAIREKGPRGGSKEWEESVVCLACHSSIH